MSKNEKGYFKLYASKHFRGKENISVKLFEAIDKQKTYNEGKIIRQMRKVPSAIRFSKEKNYLYHLILKILRNFHANQSIDIQLMGLLQDVEILYNKALLRQCSKLLTKAKKIAYEHEKYLQILGIIKWEEKLYFSGKVIKSYEKPVLEEGEILNKIENTHEYDRLLSMVLKLTKGEGLLTSRNATDMLSTIIKHPLLNSEQQAYSYEAKSRYYHIFSLYFQAMGDLAQSYRICTKWVDLLESNTELINDDPLRYIASLNNLLLSMDRTVNQDEFLLTLEKLRTLPRKFPDANSESIRVILFLRYYGHRLAFFNHRGDFERTVAQIQELEAELLEYKGKLDKKHQLTLFLYIANAYFSLNDLSNAIKWLNKIINDPDTEARQDVHSFARILNLIVRYERGNKVLLKSLIQSTYRFLAKRNRLFRFESTVLEFFREELFKTSSHNELTIAFKKLRKELNKYLRDPSERKALEYFDFISWLESKIEGKPISAIILRKLRGKKQEALFVDHCV